MNGAILAALLVLSGVLPPLIYMDILAGRRMSCDGCRVEALGSQSPYVEHTCSRRRARYRDSKGRVFQFGARVWSPGDGDGA
jgi:hypothetical protein